MDNNPRTLTSNQPIPPIAYIVERRTIHCNHCHTNHEFSEAFELRVYRNYKNLAPLRSMADVKYNMPIRIDNRGTSFTAMCHECITTGMLNHLPRPPRAQAPIVAGYTAPDKPTKQPKTKHTPSIDDTD